MKSRIPRLDPPQHLLAEGILVPRLSGWAKAPRSSPRVRRNALLMLHAFPAIPFQSAIPTTIRVNIASVMRKGMVTSATLRPAPAPTRPRRLFSTHNPPSSPPANPVPRGWIGGGVRGCRRCRCPRRHWMGALRWGKGLWLSFATWLSCQCQTPSGMRAFQTRWALPLAMASLERRRGLI